MRFSLRVQIVGLGTGILFGGMLAYFYLATTQVTQDKLAYVYDVNASLIAARSQQMRSYLSLWIDKLHLVARQRATRDSLGNEILVRQILRGDTDLLSVALWKKKGYRFEIAYRYINNPTVEKLGLPLQVVADLHEIEAIDFPRLESTGLLIQNVSIPPDQPILRIAVAASRTEVAVADLSPQGLLRIFEASAFYRSYAVDSAGHVLLHSDPAMMVKRENFVGTAVVQAAFRSKVKQGVREVRRDGEDFIAAYSKVGIANVAAISEVPRTTALLGIRRLGERSLLFAGLILLVMLSIAILFSSRIVAPLRRLRKAAEQVARGEPVDEIPTEGASEFKTLVITFNRMTRMIATREQQHFDVLSAIGGRLAHQLNNPLLAVIANESFCNEVLEEVEQHLVEGNVESVTSDLRAVRDALQDSSRASGRIRKIIDGLRELSRADTSEVENVDVVELLSSTVDAARAELESHARIELDLQPVQTVATHRAQLGRVFDMLLQNALKSVSGGERDTNEIRVSTRSPGQGVVVEISDTGAGMDPKLLAQVLDPLFTAKGSDSGDGFELSISKGIVANMGGVLTASSEVGEGTAISLHLPTAAAPSHAAAPVQGEAFTRHARRSAERVLIIDDDLLVAHAVERLIGAKSQVEVMSDGREACDRLVQGARFDLVLCDLAMPGFSGAELYASLEQRRPDVVGDIVFMTGGAFTDEAKSFIARVPNRCLEKPIGVSELEEILGRTGQINSA